MHQLLGCGLPDLAWAQAQLALKQGGLGLQSASAVADAAYLGSRVATLERCRPLLHAYQHEGIADLHVVAAVERCNQRLRAVGMQPSLSPVLAEPLQQRAVARALAAAGLVQWRASAAPDDLCRLHAAAAPGATTLWNLVPSFTLDNALSHADFIISLKLRLGVDVEDAASPCRYCGLLADPGGRHALSCMSGGDAVSVHNQVRDIVYDYCKRARLRPVLEAAGVLHGAAVARRRPADILLPQPGALLDRLPDGSWRPPPGPLALDFAIINALGSSHREATRQAPAAAAGAYDTHKRRHQRTDQLCQVAGVAYQPIMLEAQGGYAKDAIAVLHRPATAVAVTEGADAASIRDRLLQQLAVTVARASARAVRRRGGDKSEAAPQLRSACAGLEVDP